jgi:hypothetical protein
VPLASRAAPTALAALATLVTLAGVAAIALSVAREVDAGADGIGEILRGLLVGQVWPVLTGLAAAAAGVLALARRPAADFALALAGVCVALFAGVANAAVLARSIAPVPWPALAARLVVAGVIAAGVGVAMAAVLRMRAGARTAPAARSQPTART